jgi:hypothetical protein
MGMADRESLVELVDIPASDPGAPCPVTYANEHKLLVAYYLSSRIMDDSQEKISGLVLFEHVNSHLFGSPNDEALHGHRLAKIGLQPYSFYEVRGSNWIADLCARNRVHPQHQESAYASLRHFVFTFHDTTLEVVARAYSASVDGGEPIDCIRKRLEDGSKWA